MPGSRALWISWLGVFALIVASGCAFNRSQLNDPNFEERVFSKVVPGKTTLAELEELAAGPATSITPMGRKRLLVYSFSDAKTAGLALIILNISKTNSGFDTALFLVDENDVVESKQIGQNSKDLRWQWWAFGD